MSSSNVFALLPHLFGWALLISLPITIAMVAAVEAILGIRPAWTSRRKYWIAGTTFILAAGVPFIVATGLFAVSDSKAQPLTNEIQQPVSPAPPSLTAASQVPAANTEILSRDTSTINATAPLIDVARILEAINSFVPLLFWLWFVVAALRVSMVFWAKRRLRQEIENYSVPLAATIQHQVDALVRKMDFRRHVAVQASELQPVPTVFGWRRPIILLCEAARQLPPNKLLPIMLHELAHVTRHDALAATLQTMIKVTFGHDPAIHWLSRRIDLLREECCDDDACRVLGDTKQYTEALLAFADARNATAALAIKRGTLELRVRRLLVGQHRRWFDIPLALAALLVCVGGFLTTRYAVAAVYSANLLKIEEATSIPQKSIPESPTKQPIVDQDYVEFDEIVDSTSETPDIFLGDQRRISFRHRLEERLSFRIRASQSGPIMIQVRSLSEAKPLMFCEWPSLNGLASDSDGGSGRAGTCMTVISLDDKANTWVTCRILNNFHSAGMIMVSAWHPNLISDIDADVVSQASSLLMLDDYNRAQVPRRQNERPPAIDYQGDIDTFQIWPQREGILTVNVDGYRNRLKPYCYVYTHSGKPIESVLQEDTGTVYRFTLDRDKAGYHIAVTSRDETSTGEYMLVAHFDPATN